MVDFCFWRPHHSGGNSFKTRELNLWFYFNRIQKHQIPFRWAQCFWIRPSGGRNSIHKPLTGQSSVIGLSVPSATLWRNGRRLLVERLSDPVVTLGSIFCCACLALLACAKNWIQFHAQWNRKSVNMNIQRIQLILSPVFSESRWEKVKQEMSFFTKKNRKISFMQNKKLILYD